MFNVDALVYFTSYHSQGVCRWPKTPEEVLQNGCKLCVRIPPDVLYFANTNPHVPEDGYTECWHADTPVDLCNAVFAAVTKLKHIGVDAIFSVHPRSILLPLFKWRLMRNVDHEKSINAQMLQELSRKTVDLCDAFHSPAVLTFEQRSNFGPSIVGSWLDLPSSSGSKEYGDEVIIELWRRLL